MKKRVIVIPAILIVIGAAAAGFYVRSQRDPRTIVALDSVSTAHLTKEVIASGEIVSINATTAAASVSGRIATVSVTEGDRVFRGSVLARMDDEDLLLREQSALYAVEAAQRGVRQELMSLRPALAEAKAALDQATRSYERTQELRKIGSASMDALTTAEENLTAARRAYDGARERLNYREGLALDNPRENPPLPDDDIIAGSIEVKQAQATLEGIRRELAEHAITARSPGTVTEVYVTEGDFVSAGAPVARIDDWNALEVKSAVDEVDLGFVEPGQPVRIDSDSFISTTLSGTVSEIAQVIRREGDKRVCDVTVRFDDPDRLARIGASCTIYVTVRDVPDALSVPIESYFIEDGRKYVFVPVPKPEADEDQETARRSLARGRSPKAAGSAYFLEKREIRVGIIGLGRAQVTGGLALGDRIVARGVRELSDGQEVYVPAEAPQDVTAGDESPETNDQTP